MNKHPEKHETISYLLNDDGQFPNSIYPVLLYKGILNVPFFRPAAFIETLFKQNGWSNFWRAGIYEYLHYHSNTHEVMGVYKGKTTLLLGGLKGMKLEIEKGDVLIIPAGVAHQNLNSENKVKCVGAYPGGIKYDMKYGKPDERPQSDKNIKNVDMPMNDPVFGRFNGISEYWK
ncbi:MAG TPA: cupin domain-containing protein [Bacteroidia bacterium]|jgi:uncharacterized protein YjlB|nr:cupin domain-containing protein [Bacteroidia bacterium]